LKYRTAADSTYPSTIQNSTQMVIEMQQRYPFVEPTVTIKSKILHPNVYSSGRICLGRKWMPTETLDLFVKRIISIIIFDESVINTSSPANTEALQWYNQARRKSPNTFPSDSAAFISAPLKTQVTWTNLR